MAWITNNGTIDTHNIRSGVGSFLVYHLKELFVAAGWSVEMSGDGIAAYSGSGDVITQAGSGANGMDNTNAWFRIADPDGGREYVFQRGANHYTWIWQYSVSAGFVGGSPNATTIPTATDSQGLAKQSSSLQTMFPTSNGYICHMAAQDTAEGGVYAWYLLVVTPNVSAHESIWACEAMDSRYNPGGADSDPCVHVGSDDTVQYTSWAGTNTTGGDNWCGFMDHGGGSEEFTGISIMYSATASPVAVPGAMGSNVHTKHWPLFPLYWARHSITGSTTGFKGQSKFLRWKPRESSGIALKYPAVVTDTVNGVRYLIWEDLAIPGWPAGVSPEA